MKGISHFTPNLPYCMLQHIEAHAHQGIAEKEEHSIYVFYVVETPQEVKTPWHT